MTAINTKALSIQSAEMTSVRLVQKTELAARVYKLLDSLQSSPGFHYQCTSSTEGSRKIPDWSKVRHFVSYLLAVRVWQVSPACLYQPWHWASRLWPQAELPFWGWRLLRLVPPPPLPGHYQSPSCHSRPPTPPRRHRWCCPHPSRNTSPRSPTRRCISAEKMCYTNLCIYRYMKNKWWIKSRG